MTIVGSAGTPGVVVPAHDGWLGIKDQNRGRGSFEVRGIFGTGTSVQLGIQTATDLRVPDTGATAITTATTTNGVVDPKSAADAIAMLDKQAYRYVWIIFTTTGVGGAWVGGYGETFQD
jgi:hypothetical protein